ncbi:response regulator [Phorcysia thermohydrogeniphila]|uniref:Response regulator receiver domain-containing protein n=1 Tax=Phorcysia thermohydrogeniphila TaxID=936138 RepID=A0A4R1GHH9_9BACT|nr:response regulator [Phorcysia thermohydrogeniphila]TCK06440.1 response regulator receiver domain-containing protein [Phorcysia thermohydrogeniphila]
MKVLFADDKKTWHILMEKVLSLRGVEVVHAYSPKEISNLAVAEKPDVIILDMTVQNAKAYDVLPQLLNLGVPVLVIGYEKEGFDASRLKTLGAAKLLKKPFTVDELIASLRELKAKLPELKKEEELELVFTVPPGAKEEKEEFKPAEPKLEELSPVESVPEIELQIPSETEEKQELEVIPIEIESEPEVAKVEPEVQLEEVTIQPEKAEEENVIDLGEVGIQPEEIPVQKEEVPEVEKKVVETAKEKVEERVGEAAKAEVQELLSNKELVENIIREVVWEVVPEIAEKVIREEIEKLIKSRLA